MEERQSRLSSMVWRRLRPYFCVLLIPQNSMFSNFCHVLNSFPYTSSIYLRETLVAKIRIIFSDQAHSSLKKRGFAKIQNNDEPSTPTGVELQVTAHDTMCGSKCLPNPRPQRRSNLSTDYMVRPHWGRMYRSHRVIRKSLTLRLTEVRPFSGSVCTLPFYMKCRC